MTDEDVERWCEAFHDSYEKAAVGAGWETQEKSRKPWSEVPEANKETMRTTIREVVPLILGDVKTSRGDFQNDLQRLLNYHSIDSRVNVHDFVLASFLTNVIVDLEHLAHTEKRLREDT